MSAGHDPLVQEKDKIESGTIIGVGVTALVIFALGVVWAIQIQRDSTGTIRSYTPEQVPVGKVDEVGIVYQSAFDRAFADKLHAEQRAHLDSVGWVDQKAKKAHIPIERAIKDYVAEAEKNGGKL
jgi:hypothetical protein